MTGTFPKNERGFFVLRLGVFVFLFAFFFYNMICCLSKFFTYPISYVIR